jgi:hypothetical protein
LEPTFCHRVTAETYKYNFYNHFYEYRIRTHQLPFLNKFFDIGLLFVLI